MYTHYFTPRGAPPSVEQWKELCTEARKIIKRHRQVLCVEYDQPNKPPAVNDRYIMFNGRGDDGCETLVLERLRRDGDFCKTARRPYDEAVVEVLRAAKRCCPGWLKLHSDGDEKAKPVFP